MTTAPAPRGLEAPQHAHRGAPYYAHTRRDVIGLLGPADGGRVLEVGCGRGHTLMALKRSGRAHEVVGVDRVALARTDEEVAGVDRYIVADVETDALDLPVAYFDVLICADVLEHLSDPWTALQRLQALLRPGGLLLASVPNVRELRTLYNLAVRGDFAYTDAGVLDRTHLRFFCRRNILALLTSAGGRVERVSNDLATRSNWRARLHRASFGVLEEFLVTQYLVAVRVGA